MKSTPAKGSLIEVKGGGFTGTSKANTARARPNHDDQARESHSTLRIRCSSKHGLWQNCRANPFNACQLLGMYTRSIGCVRAILLTLNRWTVLSTSTRQRPFCKSGFVRMQCQFERAHSFVEILIHPAPVIRNAGAEREMVLMRWGMPPPRIELDQHDPGRLNEQGAQIAIATL
jgi:hypothetical protein